ncbi:effector-associated domain EAD1-containing protein [Geodermatophilus telluris]|uniref:effector-associated domain EAD1-containing protein n=1 Tax=Geodermatophilus telluris TaxID=1190417 RepID=UPI003CCBC0C8
MTLLRSALLNRRSKASSTIFSSRSSLTALWTTRFKPSRCHSSDWSSTPSSVVTRLVTLAARVTEAFARLLATNVDLRPGNRSSTGSLTCCPSMSIEKAKLSSNRWQPTASANFSANSCDIRRYGRCRDARKALCSSLIAR